MAEPMNVFWGLEVKPGKVGAFVPPPEECKLHISQARPPAHRSHHPAGAAAWCSVRWPPFASAHHRKECLPSRSSLQCILPLCTCLLHKPDVYRNDTTHTRSALYIPCGGTPLQRSSPCWAALHYLAGCCIPGTR